MIENKKNKKLKSNRNKMKNLRDLNQACAIVGRIAKVNKVSGFIEIKY